VSERQVSRYVRDRRRELGDVGEAFVPQHHEPGMEGEVDWGEAWAVIDGEVVKVHLFQLRLCHSGAAFAAAFRSETQQAFLEGHVEAFEFLGGVPGRVRYDNLTSAVKQVLPRRPGRSDGSGDSNIWLPEGRHDQCGVAFLIRKVLMARLVLKKRL